MPYRPLATEGGRIHVCAHRGHSVGAPENTLAALETAADLGATTAEIDVVLTADEQIVLLHDEVIDRTTNGKGRVAALDLAAVRRLDAGRWFGPEFAGTPIPTLAEALALARGRGMGLHVEIKERARSAVMIERLAQVIETEGAADDVLVISFDHVSLLRLKERLPAVRTEIITHARHVDITEIAVRAGAASVSIEWDMFDPVDAQALHAIGVAVRVTIPRPEKIAWRKRYGFDDEARFRSWLATGAIDILAGDDTAYLRALVDGASGAVR